MPAVTIGVPVYRGEAFVEEALRSIQAQTFPDFQVLISLDGPDPVGEERCRAFLADRRFRLVVQPQRQGWVGNLNWLMEQVDTPFWYYHQQDDVVLPHYLETLLSCAEATPEAAVVYCDLEAFGMREGVTVQSSVLGSPVGRLLTLLYDHHPAVAFRGVTRREALACCAGLRPNEVENFAADTTWMAGVARWGELRRVPEVLYRKRYHPENVHTRWAEWPLEKRERAWTAHCRDMLSHAMQIKAALPDRRLLWLATVHRVTSSRTAASYLPIGTMSRGELARLTEAFLKSVDGQGVAGWLQENWSAVRAWTRAVFCTPQPPAILQALRSRLRGG
jgi:glycosyltransferase involved in cell wall biosynthesis